VPRREDKGSAPNGHEEVEFGHPTCIGRNHGSSQSRAGRPSRPDCEIIPSSPATAWTRVLSPLWRRIHRIAVGVWRRSGHASSWVNELDEDPWRAPSIPVAEFSNPPEYEVRYAEIPGTDGVMGVV
jgi:hypothetical protein